MNRLDKDYQALLQDILDNGVTKQDRTGTGTISVFGRQIRHKMSEGFPLLTTKKMPFKTIVTELLWFLRGDTNIKYLVDSNCHIWDGDCYKSYKQSILESFDRLSNDPVIDAMPPRILSQEEFINKIKTDDDFAKKWGELGPIYGKQWRKWESDDTDAPRYEHWKKDIDQIQNSIDLLKTDPDSRRNRVSSWNVGELDQMVLPPCHTDFQFYTRELSLDERKNIWNKHNFSQDMSWHNMEEHDITDLLNEDNIPTRAISLMWNQRSVDTFLGLPFNIASYGLLLEIIAKEVNMVPEELIGNLGDVHLYSNHIEQAKEQIGRELTLDERNDLLYTKIGGTHKRENCFSDEEFERETLTDCKAFNIPTRTREPFPLPTLKELPDYLCVESWECYEIDDIQIDNYQSHPTIKAPLSN